MKITTNFSQIHDANTAIEAAMVGKTFVTPSCKLSIDGPDKFSVTIGCHYTKGPRLEHDSVQFHNGKTAGEAYRNALKFLSELPDENVAAMQSHMKRIADCIDKGRADGIADEYITPLCVVNKAMSDNLLAAPKEAAQ